MTELSWEFAVGMLLILLIYAVPALVLLAIVMKCEKERINEEERMSELQRKKHLLFIIDTYGTKAQQDIAIEELSELQKAILKHRRLSNKETEKYIIDEIADVSIMLEQLKIIYSCSREVEERIDYKIDRQIKRIMKNEDNK